MTGEQLIDRVIKTVQDPSIESDEILDLLNEGLIEIAGRVRLPGLETTAEVVTVLDEFQVALPADYQHGLFDCQDQDKYNPIRVLNSKRQMLAKYGDLESSGLVRHVCAPAMDTLFYVPVPVEVRTLTISYYRLPDELTESESPSCLPAQFHKVLFRYACAVLFDDIEDGMEGAKVNTGRHESKYEELVAKLQLFYREGQSFPRPPVVKGSFL